MSARCEVCHAPGVGDPASCDHGASLVLQQLARRTDGRGYGQNDLGRLTGVPLSTLSQVLLGDAIREVDGSLLTDGLVERRPFGLSWRYTLTDKGRQLLAESA